MVKLLTAEIARALLTYDPETGVVTRKRVPGRRHAGDAVGSPNNKGYLHAYIYDTNYLVHRVVWLLVHGRWPTEQLDHIDHDRTNNRLVNLRECTNAENRQNTKLHSRAQSGYTGVYPSGDRWAAAITLNGVTEQLGYFESREVARKTYLTAKLRTHYFVAKDEALIQAAQHG